MHRRFLRRGVFALAAMAWQAVRDLMIRPVRHLRFGASSRACVVAVSIATLSVGEAVFAQDRDGAMLHEAAGRGERAAVLRLLDRGADIDARDEQGRTALHRAAGSCFQVGQRICRGVVAALLDRGADVDARDAGGSTPLHLAAGWYDSGVVVELLRRGADVDARDDEGRTPLHVAAEYGVAGRFSFFNPRGTVSLELLQRGAVLDVRDADGRTPLQMADERDRTGLVRLLRRWDEADTETVPTGGAGVRVEMTVSSVMRFFEPISLPDLEHLAYVEAVLFGPFFERGRNEELTIRLVPDLSRGFHDDNRAWWFAADGSVDPWGAWQRFAQGTIEFFRGAHLLARVRNTNANWTEVDGVSYSPQTGLLNLHLFHVNIGSGGSDYDVFRYDSMTSALEMLRFPSVYDGFPGPLMTCTGEQQRWPAAPSIGHAVFFQPCRSAVERVRGLYAVAGDLRAWGDGVVVDSIAVEPDTVIDLACAACAVIDDATFSARLMALRRAADLVEPYWVSIGRFESAAFELVAVNYLAAGDSRPSFDLLFARRRDGPWRPIYGWERDSRFGPSGVVEGFVPGAGALVRLSVYSWSSPPREALLDLDARTFRVAPVP